MTLRAHVATLRTLLDDATPSLVLPPELGRAVEDTVREAIARDLDAAQAASARVRVVGVDPGTRDTRVYLVVTSGALRLEYRIIVPTPQITKRLWV